MDEKRRENCVGKVPNQPRDKLSRAVRDTIRAMNQHRNAQRYAQEDVAERSLRSEPAVRAPRLSALRSVQHSKFANRSVSRLHGLST